jgi:hypothetical protein
MGQLRDFYGSLSLCVFLFDVFISHVLILACCRFLLPVGAILDSLPKIGVIIAVNYLELT